MKESSDFKIFFKLNSESPEKIFFLKRKEPFQFLVTVILSGSSTDKQAELSADRLFSKFPDAEAVSKATEEEIGAEIHASGLFRAKAHNIHELAKIVVERGSIPETMEELVQLPGVGEKTAGCYLSAILGQPAVNYQEWGRRLPVAIFLPSLVNLPLSWIPISPELPNVWASPLIRTEVPLPKKSVSAFLLSSGTASPIP